MMQGGDGQHGQAGPTASRPTYRLIQVLRAVAAIMVVVHHATQALSERRHVSFITPNWLAGISGVDIFFVISGFVMMISSAPLRSAKHPARIFLARRLERVVPMYWLVTTVKLLSVLAVPAAALNGLGTPLHVISSYLFLPPLNQQSPLEPLLVVGWTLNFEMGFYVLLACALAWRLAPARWLVPLLLLVPFSPIIPGLQRVPFLWWYANSLCMDFAFGMLLVYAVRALHRVPKFLALCTLIAGFLALWLAPGLPTPEWRALEWGIPAAVIVASAISLERYLGPRTPRFLLELGDASYSIYLVHGLVVPLGGLVVMRWPPRSAMEELLGLILLVAMGVFAGWVVYRLVELPMIRWFKGRRRTAIPVNA